MDMSNPLTVVGIVLTAFIVLMVLSVVLEFLSHPIRFLAKIVLKIAGILFVILAMFQIADLINNKGVILEIEEREYRRRINRRSEL